jgi:hypothetical protein
LKYIHSSIRLQSNLRISHRIRDLKGTSEVVNKETLYLNIKHPDRMFTANKKIILKLNLTFKVKQILKSASNYVSNVLDVTAYMRWCGAYLFFLHLLHLCAFKMRKEDPLFHS